MYTAVRVCPLNQPYIHMFLYTLGKTPRTATMIVLSPAKSKGRAQNSYREVLLGLTYRYSALCFLTALAAA